MLTELSTVKLRLGIAPADVSQDALLTAFIEAVSARFDTECNRALARAEAATHEFAANDREIIPPCYPIESVTRFDLKESETGGWVEQSGVDYLIRGGCVVSLSMPLGGPADLGRMTYTGGYVLPGVVPGPGQTALPKDLQHAATEQVAAWHLNRDKLGLIRHWPNAGTYLVISQQPLLISVAALLRRYQRWSP